MRHVIALLTLALVASIILAPPAFAADPVRVMALGDSIAAALHDPPTGGWRHWTKGLLDSNGYQTDFVGSQSYGNFLDNQHEGHPGWTAGMLDAQIAGWIQTYQPDLVLLEAGTVNLVSTGPAEAPEVALDELMSLIGHIHGVRPTAIVLVSSLPPLRDTPDSTSRGIMFNGLLPLRIAAYRAATGRDARYVNVGGTLQPSDLQDDVHPNPQGHVKLGNLWYAEVVKALAPTVDCTLKRPPVQISRQVIAPGQMRVTVRAGIGLLYGVTFGAGGNVLPVTDLAINGSVATFTVKRLTPGGSVHLPFTVTDACGPWQTFVGGGPGAF